MNTDIMMNQSHVLKKYEHIYVFLCFIFNSCYIINIIFRLKTHVSDGLVMVDAVDETVLISDMIEPNMKHQHKINDSYDDTKSELTSFSDIKLSKRESIDSNSYEYDKKSHSPSTSRSSVISNESIKNRGFIIHTNNNDINSNTNNYCNDIKKNHYNHNNKMKMILKLSYNTKIFIELLINNKNNIKTSNNASKLINNNLRFLPESLQLNIINMVAEMIEHGLTNNKSIHIKHTNVSCQSPYLKKNVCISIYYSIYVKHTRQLMFKDEETILLLYILCMIYIQEHSTYIFNIYMH